MHYLHIIDNKSDTIVHYAAVAQVPSVGDEIRLADDKIYEVIKIVWCLDEYNPVGLRVNVGVERVDL